MARVFLVTVWTVLGWTGGNQLSPASGELVNLVECRENLNQLSPPELLYPIPLTQPIKTFKYSSNSGKNMLIILDVIKTTNSDKIKMNETTRVIFCVFFNINNE